METYNYKATVTWTHDLTGWGEPAGVLDSVKFSAPPEFGGQAGLWSPETFFVLAANSCLMSTLLVLAKHSKLTFASYESEGEAVVERVAGQGYRFKQLTLRPVVTVVRESEIPAAQALLTKAQGHCLVTNALAVPVRIEGRVEMMAPALHG